MHDSFSLSPAHAPLKNKLRVTMQWKQFTKGESRSKSVLTGVHIHGGAVGRGDYLGQRLIGGNKRFMFMAKFIKIFKGFFLSLEWVSEIFKEGWSQGGSVRAVPSILCHTCACLCGCVFIKMNSVVILQEVATYICAHCKSASWVYCITTELMK